MSERPRVLVGIAGTGTEVGKTWVTAAVLAHLRGRGVVVCARKPVQSFEDGEDPARTDAAVLAAAAGCRPDEVCPPHRSYPLAMAPPAAAAELGRPAFTVAELVAEIAWGPCDAGFVETVGGVRSPIAADGDSLDLLRAVRPDVVLLVADAGLGAINAVRLSVGALAEFRVVVLVNRYDAADRIHNTNRECLVADGLTVATEIAALPACLSLRA